MDKLIKEKLVDIEREHDIKILYACEAGSRAWGFPSPDSDYDVRFIYLDKVEKHVSLFNHPDTIELPINNNLDIGGWELRKALGLLQKSNAPLLEWIQSPIVYRDGGQFLQEFRKHAEAYYSPIATMHHYLSMARKYWDACMAGSEVKLKTYFYAIRTAVACKWILTRQQMPHMELGRMLEVVDEAAHNQIVDLVDKKAKEDERTLHKRIDAIDQFIVKTLAEAEQQVLNLSAGKGNANTLDQFYRQTVLEQ